ncbi:hypothetical protein JCM3775_005787 [Rhodotorula graminis]|uniref:Uncharacterized protein n=1 Tax=Rhodotorula graminis (strain WP1) TaxID=578459 RepID=A0A194S891_RHOGW|nr:uncharacterized protein RHOBADRAFT_52673 [Rhodotorula graminis WP1]KPV75626.1 hypothetical protein RHOBADRAFT_52673 [Rhodotorula graminis WP1]
MKLAELIRGVVEVNRLLGEYKCYYLIAGQAALAAHLAHLVTKLATLQLDPSPAINACLYGDRPGPLYIQVRVESIVLRDSAFSRQAKAAGWKLEQDRGQPRFGVVYCVTVKSGRFVVELVPSDNLSAATPRKYVAVAVPKSNEIVEVPTSLVVDRTLHLVRSWLTSLAPGHHAPMPLEHLEELRLLVGTQSYVDLSLGHPHLFDLNAGQWTRHVPYLIQEKAYKATAELLFKLRSLKGVPRLAWDNTTAEHFDSASLDFVQIQSQWAAALGLLITRFQIIYPTWRAGTAT